MLLIRSHRHIGGFLALKPSCEKSKVSTVPFVSALATRCRASGPLCEVTGAERASEAASAAGATCSGPVCTASQGGVFPLFDAGAARQTGMMGFLQSA